MFKIEKLTFVSINNESYDYVFNNGLNYFESGNNTGKTEFYNLLDFMFGHSMSLNDIECYKGCISNVRMQFSYRGASFIAVRTVDYNINYIYNTDEGQDDSDVLTQEEYRIRLNKIFTLNEQKLKEMREFAEEDLTFRTFSMFNFLDEKSQGKIQDFLSKCTQVEYSTKLNTVLNYIFNKNLNEIRAKEQEIENLQKQLKEMESKQTRSNFLLDKINTNLRIISPNVYYTGSNRDEIKDLINEIKDMSSSIQPAKDKDIADLEVMYNSLSEQIKKYKNEIADIEGIKRYDSNRIKLISLLKELIENKSELEYLINPIDDILQELNEGISFENYIIKDETVKKLEKQLDGIKQDISRNDSRFKLYSLSEKEKAITIVEDYLKSDIEFVDEEIISELKKKITLLKKEIKTLQNADDIEAINDFSKYITDMYASAKEISNFVSEDLEFTGFRIKYFKRGNSLQLVRTEIDKETNNAIEKPYYTGSMARHTLIQLCGYAAFLSKLIRSNKYPIIPIFVIDHISKAFDDENCKAIGIIIKKLLTDLGEKNIQIFMFDSEKSENLGIDSKYSTALVTEEKTGLCPFYHKEK